MTDLIQKLVGTLEMADDAFDLEGFHPEGATRREIRAALSAAKDGGWQPIETAPKDGTHILAFDGRGITIAFWGRAGHSMNRLAWIGGHCKIDHIDQPTHWQPLPNPPKEQNT